MLRKLIAIKKVGRFLNYSAGGDVELKRYNLIFAENGRGKTTLCAIFRSLQANDPAIVKGRTTLGATSPPEIRLLRGDGQTVTFANGAWNAALPNFAIFDSTFIAENVYSGDVVDLEHRKRLYGVIVGKVGAELARRIDELDDASREKSAEIREKRAAVQALAQGLTPDAFLALPADPAIDDRTLEKEGDLAAIRQADQIKTRAALSPLTLPGLPGGIAELLARTLDGVSADAAAKVDAQVHKHELLDRTSIGWLNTGLRHIREDACPFCGQGLAGVDLVAAYRAYFSEEYNGLRQAVAELRQQVSTELSDRAIADAERAIDQNTAAVEFWFTYCPLTAPAVPAWAGDALRSLREAALAMLDHKTGAPLDPIAPDAAFTAAAARLVTLQEAAAAYNTAVTVANGVIAAKKQATTAADVKAVQGDLARLRATKARHEPAGAGACKDLEAAIAQKDVIEREKDSVKKKLDDYARDVMSQYEKTINRLLGEFQAGFKITGTSHSFAGGTVSSSYKLMINDMPVDLGNPETAADTPSFRNTLSSGDKSTLALAFFLAQLEHDAEKTSRIVVFDDPFNSQDAFRKDCTIQKIKRCGAACAQVIVSHDPDFLKRIWDRLEPTDRKALKLARVGTRDTTILAFDIEEATQAAYKAQRKVLLEFYHESKGDLRDVVQKIRPVLETYCKILGAGLLADNDTLGVIGSKIRGAGAGHQLFPLADDLEDLNDYTKRYHHGENDNAATEPISDTELQGKVGLTLELTGGC